MDNSVMLDYLAVTIKGLAPDDVIEKIKISLFSMNGG